MTPLPWVEHKTPFTHLKRIASKNCWYCLLRSETSDDVEPPPAAATNPDFYPPPACAFALLASRVFIYDRVAALVVVNRSLLSTRRLRTSLSLVATAERLSM